MIATEKLNIDSLVDLQLPPLPGSAIRVAALAQNVNTSAREMADVIGCDPALATRVLRAVNSPLYAMERRFTALPMAVNALGNHAIHMLVVVSATSDAFSRKGKRTPLEKELWEHSVKVGVAAREISAALGMRGGEESFLCGLLHDIGKLLLVRHDPTGYAEIAKMPEEHKRLQCESECYGFNHAQIGALVIRRWNLPDVIGDVINHHHWPSEAGQSIFLTRAVNLADEMVYHGGLTGNPEEDQILLSRESVAALRLTEDQLRQIWTKTQQAVKEMSQILS